jgi:hypothetical protein
MVDDPAAPPTLAGAPASLLEPAPDSLEGAMVERVDRPLGGLYALSLGLRGSRVVLLLAAGPPRRRPAFSLTADRPRGAPADGEVRGLREKLEGGRIVRTFHTSSSLCLEVRRGDAVAWLAADRAGLACVVPVSEALPEGDPIGGAQLAAAVAVGDAILAEQRALAAEGARALAARLLTRTRDRMNRRARAIARDIEQVGSAEARAREATLFVPQAAGARPGDQELTAVDWSSGEAVEISFPLDPSLPARQQLEAVFARARRLRGGVPVAERRRDEAARAVGLIDEALASLSTLADDAAVEARLRALAAALPSDARLAPRQVVSSRKQTRRSRPYRRYAAASGAAILVGRDAASNDELTVKIARAADLWLHARGCAGAHVVLPGWRRSGADPQALLDAATLAAHFSERRGEAIIDVVHAERRHVIKRRGSPVGQVEVERERVLALRLEPGRLERLLATCDRDLGIP